MDFHSFHRRDLQSLCKLNKIPANMTNLAMATALQALSKVEGLDSFKESQQSTPARTAGGRTASAVGRSCRGTSRTTAKKEDGASEGVGIPNSPTTLSARGRRTRTIVMRNLEPKEEEEGNKAPDLVKTPAARSTRGRKSTDTAQKSSIGEKKTDGQAPSTRRTTRASAIAMNPSATRTSCCRSRLSSRRKIADDEKPAKGLDMSNENEYLAEEGDVAESSPQMTKASPQPDPAVDFNHPTVNQGSHSVTEELADRTTVQSIIEGESSDPTAVDNSYLVSELFDQTAVEDSNMEKSINRTAVKVPTENVNVPEEDPVLIGSNESTVTEDSCLGEGLIDQTATDKVTEVTGVPEENLVLSGSDDLTATQVPEQLDAAENSTVAAEEIDGEEEKPAARPADLTVVAEIAGEEEFCSGVTAMEVLITAGKEGNDAGVEAAAEPVTVTEKLTVAAANFAGEVAETKEPEEEKSKTGIEDSTVAAEIIAGEENSAMGIEDPTVAAAEFLGEAAEKNKENLEACQKYDGATSLRKLKAAVKEKLQAMEEKKKRAALASLDDNSILFSPGRVRI